MLERLALWSLQLIKSAQQHVSTSGRSRSARYHNTAPWRGVGSGGEAYDLKCVEMVWYSRQPRMASARLSASRPAWASCWVRLA